jgi:hypothetical protein
VLFPEQPASSKGAQIGVCDARRGADSCATIDGIIGPLAVKVLGQYGTQVDLGGKK